MKVVHLVPALEQGGVETVVCDLVKALKTCESVVVSKGGRLVGRIEAAGGRHVTLDLKSKNPLTYFSRVWKLRKVLKDEKPDLVCAHSRVPAWLYVGVRKINSAIRLFGCSVIDPPWITYAHGANSVSRYSAVMTKGDLVVTPSRYLADYLKASYGTSEAKIWIVPNAVDTERFDPDHLDEGFIAEKRREWGIEPGDRVTMAVGRITPVKGLEGLIKEFSSRTSGQETASTLKLVIVGGADKHHLKYLESLKALAKDGRRKTGDGSPGDSSRVIFAGPQAKVPECLAIADEVVSANVTKPETFGLSIAEAYAMNRPVRVLRRFGGVAEVMDAVETAGCASTREAVIRLYGSDRYAERTMAVYREVLAKL